jgi:hypothetical protein
VIALQAGHKTPDTTWSSYTKRGPDMRQRYGEPFPPLPAELVGSTRGGLAKRLAKEGSDANDSQTLSAERAGFEPAVGF